MNKIFIYILFIMFSIVLVNGAIIYTNTGNNLNIPSLTPTTNVNNTIIINVTNNITNYVTSWNNITNNFTNNIYIPNLTLYVTNNITNNISYNYTTILNYSYYMISISPYLMAGNNTPYINFNETKLNETITNVYNNLIIPNIYGEIFYNNISGLSVTIGLNTTNAMFGYFNSTLGISNGCSILNNYYLRCNTSGIYDIRYYINGELDNNNYLYSQLFISNLKVNSTLIYQKPFANQSIEYSSETLFNYSTNSNIDVRLTNTQVNSRIFKLYNYKIIVQLIG